MLTYATPKGNPHAIPTGAPPTFAADLSDLSDWFAGGRSIRRAATQAALVALTGMADRDLAVVDTVVGGLWTYNGATAKWVLGGEPLFADAAARNAAITTPAVDMVTRLATERFPRRYSGTAWAPFGAGLLPIRPASVSGTGVTLANDGGVSFAASASVSVDGCFSADFDNYLVKLDVRSKSAASGVTVRLRAAGVDNSAAIYNTQVLGGNATAATAAASNSQTTWLPYLLATATRNVMDIDLFDPAQAVNTVGLIRHAERLAASGAMTNASIEHLSATAFDGMAVSFGGPTATGTLRIFGYSIG